MKTKFIKHAIISMCDPTAKEEARKELRMLLETISEQAVMIKALGGDAPEPDYTKLSDFTKAMICGSFAEPDYDSLSEFAKAELRAAAKCPRAWSLPYDKTPTGKPGDVTAIHDDSIAALAYSMVHHPKHYNTGKYEVIDVIEDWGLDFSLGNAVKYIARADYKGKKKEDLEKAIWYLQREVAKL